MRSPGKGNVSYQLIEQLLKPTSAAYHLSSGEVCSYNEALNTEDSTHRYVAKAQLLHLEVRSCVQHTNAVSDYNPEVTS
jgi:hypothetical protein